MAVNARKRKDEFFDELETAPRDTREKYLNDRLSDTVRNAYKNVPAMRKLLSSAGINPLDIKTYKDLEKLPVIRKTDLIEMQKRDIPFGGILSIPQNSIERIFISPGPVYEIQPSSVKFFARSLWAAGFRRGDIVINTFTYHMSPAGMLFHEGIRDCGATVVVAGTGNTDMQVQIIRDLKVTGFVGTPSFLMAVIQKAGELGIDFNKDTTVKKAWFTGEMLSPTLRKVFEGEYGIDTYQAYAVTEPGGCIAYECCEKSGMHFMDDYIVEIIDHETGKQLGPGETGEIVVTPVYDLNWGLLRFGTGDLSSYINEPCPCGRTSYRLTGLAGRIGDAVKVRGMFVVKKQAEQTILGSGDIARYQLIVDRLNQRDELILKIELKEANQFQENLRLTLNKKFQDICRIKIDRIDVVESGIIPDDKQGIVDKRKWD